MAKISGHYKWKKVNQGLWQDSMDAIYYLPRNKPLNLLKPGGVFLPY
ncbi:hypothetical protein [Piscirickettsia salmonis]|nr:hypothetical protein [Piscirickettsia salmonis]